MPAAALPRPSDLMRTTLREGPDHGLDLGPAAQARPWVMADVPDPASEGDFRKNLTNVRRYSDTTLFDRLHAVAQISDREHEAAVRLFGIWTAAGMNPNVTARYGERADGQHDHTEDTGEERPIDVLRRIMRKLGPGKASLIEGMFHRDAVHPGLRWMGTVHAALGDLADIFGIERVGV